MGTPITNLKNIITTVVENDATLKGEQGIQGATGLQGAQGIQGESGVNGSTWYSGDGAPNNQTGVNGDFYFDTSTGLIYKKEIGIYNVQFDINTSISATDVKTLYESNLDTNVYSDAEKLKVANTRTDTNTDLTAIELDIININTLLSSDTTTLDSLQEIVDYIELNREDLDALSLDTIVEGTTNKHYTSTEKSKLTAIEAGATADQTASEIESLYEGIANTNKFTDAYKSKVDNLIIAEEW